MDFVLFLNAAVAMLVITTPFDPVKVLFFSKAITDRQLSRTRAALAVTAYVAIILVGSAMVGGPILDLLSVDINAFTVVGGLIIAMMGFEMLYGGDASKAQGQKQRDSGPEEGDTLLIPLALPLIAGPGAIATTITMAAQEGGLLPTLFGAAIVTGTVYGSLVWLGGAIEKAKTATVALLIRIGGLLLATIGVQMLLGGLKNFFVG